MRERGLLLFPHVKQIWAIGGSIWVRDQTEPMIVWLNELKLMRKKARNKNEERFGLDLKAVKTYSDLPFLPFSSCQ